MDNRVARGASAELTGFKKQLAELTQQWNSLTAAERGSAAGAAIREKFRALRTEAQGYTSTLQAAVKAEDKMRESHSKTAASANKLSSAYHNQSTYLSRLIQRMAAYAGVSYVGNFLTNVREVTAQFELQRIGTNLRLFSGISKKYFQAVHAEDTAVAYLAAFAGGKYLDVPPAAVERVTQ